MQHNFSCIEIIKIKNKKEYIVLFLDTNKRVCLYVSMYVLCYDVFVIII